MIVPQYWAEGRAQGPRDGKQWRSSPAAGWRALATHATFDAADPAVRQHLAEHDRLCKATSTLPLA